MAKLQVLILGCNGQVGYELMQQLGDSCVPKPKEVLDVTNHKEVRELITRTKPTVVINCAANTSPTYCEKNKIPAWRVNAEAVDNMVKSCAISGIPFMHISCDQVFGADLAHKVPYYETDAIGPVNYYGITKMAAEHAVLRLGQCFCPDYWKAGFRYWVIRTSMLYERPWRSGTNWVYDMMLKGEQRRSSDVSLPIDVFRSPTYVPHFVKSLVWMCKHHREITSGIYNIASKGSPSLYDIGVELSIASKHGIRLNMTDRTAYARMHGRDPLSVPQYTALDSSKFAEISSITVPNWQAGIEEFAAAWEAPE
jgi:dTDP-4-dehydrorhamnose reductase